MATTASPGAYAAAAGTGDASSALLPPGGATLLAWPPAAAGRLWTCDVPAEQLAVIRMPGQVIGQSRADAEHRGQPVAEILFLAQRREQRSGVAGSAEDAAETGKRQVGICRRGQRGHEH